MSDKERTGWRDLTYSHWHRAASVKRFLTGADAQKLGMIDIDGCEYCPFCGQPLALIETQRSTAVPKSAAVTAALAKMAGIPAWSVSVIADEPIGCDRCGRPMKWSDIRAFLVRQIEPYDSAVVEMMPEIFAKWLLAMRYQCTCRGRMVALP